MSQFLAALLLIAFWQKLWDPLTISILGTEHLNLKQEPSFCFISSACKMDFFFHYEGDALWITLKNLQPSSSQKTVIWLVQACDKRRKRNSETGFLGPQVLSYRYVAHSFQITSPKELHQAPQKCHFLTSHLKDSAFYLQSPGPDLGRLMLGRWCLGPFSWRTVPALCTCFS